LADMMACASKASSTPSLSAIRGVKSATGKANVGWNAQAASRVAMGFNRWRRGMAFAARCASWLLECRLAQGSGATSCDGLGSLQSRQGRGISVWACVLQCSCVSF
jgi:hypothetical protein